MISNEGVGDAVRDGLRGANHSNSLAIARICNDADRSKPRPHTHEEIVNTFLTVLPSAHAQYGAWALFFGAWQGARRRCSTPPAHRPRGEVGAASTWHGVC